MRNLRILLVMICWFAVLGPAFLKVNDFNRNPDAFTVKAVFPQELSGIMSLAKIVESFPSNIPAIPADVSDIKDREIVEVYQEINCFPQKENSLVGNTRKVCVLTLYVFRDNYLPTLFVTVEVPALFIDSDTNTSLSNEPKAYAYYYAPSGSPKVFENSATQSYKKNFVTLSFWVVLVTALRLITAWGLYSLTIAIMNPYREWGREKLS